MSRYRPRPRTRNKGGRFDLTAFMAGQTDGLWYDFAKPDRLFQEDIGQTPASSPGDVIGLALSSRLWGGKTLAAYAADQPNLAPAFVAGGAGWTVTGSDATHIATFGSGSLRYQSDTTTPVLSVSASAVLQIGRVYEVKSTCTSRASGSVKTDNFGGAANLASAVGSLTFCGKASATAFAITRNSANVDLTLANLTVKEVSRYPAVQATTNYKPKFQPSGAAFDATDDYLATTYAAAAGANFVMLPKVTVPSTLSALKVLVGTLDASSYRFYLGITATGQLSGRIGSAIVETTSLDLRNGVHDIGMWTDGTTIFLYADGVIVASGALTGVVPTSAWNIGALNNNGTPTSFFGGSFKAVLAGRQALTTTQANKICAAY